MINLVLQLRQDAEGMINLVRALIARTRWKTIGTRHSRPLGDLKVEVVNLTAKLRPQLLISLVRAHADIELALGAFELRSAADGTLWINRLAFHFAQPAMCRVEVEAELTAPESVLDSHGYASVSHDLLISVQNEQSSGSFSLNLQARTLVTRAGAVGINGRVVATNHLASLRNNPGHWRFRGAAFHTDTKIEGLPVGLIDSIRPAKVCLVDLLRNQAMAHVAGSFVAGQVNDLDVLLKSPLAMVTVQGKLGGKLHGRTNAKAELVMTRDLSPLLLKLILRVVSATSSAEPIKHTLRAH